MLLLRSLDRDLLKNLYRVKKASETVRKSSSPDTLLLKMWPLSFRLVPFATRLITMRTLLLRITSSLFLSFPLVVSAQCDVGADAGQDILICFEDNTTTLNGAVSGGGVLGFVWSPSTGLSDPNSLTPTVFLDGTPRTYTLTSQGFDGANNQIVNGDFESGDTGFTTDYSPGSGGVWGPLSDEGEYVIDNNAGNTHLNFANCTDHTGGGNMIVINGSSAAGDEVWCQTVSVTPGVGYAFSAWVTGVISDNPARLQFSINGGLIGNTFAVSSATCSWQEFNELWSAGGASSAEICIVNQNTAGGGNDFALDDLFFGEVCEETDEVNIDVLTVEANAPSPIEIPCDGQVEIDASTSTFGANVFYNWFTPDGNIVSGFGTSIITVNAPGEYRLEVVFDDGVTFCVDDVTVTVTDDQPTAVAAATVNGRIDCDNPTLELSGAGSSMGPDWTYSWTTPDGNIVSGANTLTPTVDAGGTYEIVVFNPVSGCTDIETVAVIEDLSQPLAAITPSTGIPCGTGSIMLDGSLSDSGADISYSWSTTNGIIDSGASGTMPLISSPGTYQLIVGQGSNGCTDTATVVIDQQANTLMVDITAPDTLRCAPVPISLDASNSTNGDTITYNWTTTDGNILAGVIGPLPIVDAPGTYVLTLQDTSSGCLRQDSVVVVENLTPPTLSFVTPDTITCARDSAILTIAAQVDLNYAWSTNTGVIQTGQGSDSLVVATAGAYFLTIQDTISGCSSTDTINVVESLMPPIADAGVSDTITCGAPSLQLDGRNSSSGASFVYTWTTQAGDIVSGAGTQVPIVDAAGAYFLEVTTVSTGCFARDTVEVVSNDQAPVASIQLGGNLDCSNPSQELDGSASGEGSTFVWSTADGNFLSGTQTLTPQVDAAGTYVLTVTDTVNTCQTIRSVTVTQDTLHPVVSAGPDFRLDCRQPTDTLSSVGTDFGANFTFLWSTADGNFVGAATSLHPLVDRAGTYVLTVSDLTNGCVATDTVAVGESFLPPPANAGPDTVINCRDTLLTIGEDPFNPSLNYTWNTADGNIVTGYSSNQVNVNAGGTYQFVALNMDNGCAAEDSLVVTENQVLPVALIAPPAELNCELSSFALDAGGSSTGNPFAITWSTAGGNIVSGANGIDPIIDAPGDYFLLIENTDNFCLDSASVTVLGNFSFPTVEAGDSLEINCRFSTVKLSASGTDTIGNISWLWSTTDGNILDGPGVFNPEVDAVGTYFLTVNNEENSCEVTDSVVVTGDFILPLVNGGPNRTLTCIDSTFELGLDSITPGYQYFWTTFSGNITVGGLGPMVTIDAPGVYTLRVVDSDNGCRNGDNVTVGINNTAPEVGILMPAELNCRDGEVALTGQAAADLDYIWTTDSGIFSGETNTIGTMVAAPGDYQLEVVDPVNGCRRQAEVTVGQDIAPPVFTLAPAAALTCLDTIQELQANDLGAGFTYNWMSGDGNIISGASGANPSVDNAGTYVLTVTNTTNFCTSTDSLLVTEDIVAPQLTIAEPAALTCVVRSVILMGQTDLDPAGGGIEWTTSNGVLISGANTLTPSVISPGTYRLVLTSSENGCVSVDEVEVAENVAVPVIDLVENVDLGCTEDDFTLQASVTANGALSYAWSAVSGMIVSGGSTATPQINGVGNYTLIATNEVNGCVDSATVFADQNLLLDFAFTQRDPNCEFLDGTLQFGSVDGGTQPFTFSIDGGASFRSDPVFQGLLPDNYVLVVQDANGCEVERGTSIVSAPEFELAISENGIIDFGDFYQVDARINFPLSAVDTIIWTPILGLDCTDCLNPRAAPQETQSYRLRVETIDGCVAEEFLTIIVNEENPVYFPTAFSPNGDGINDTFVPFASLTRVARITSMEIFDRWGESVFVNEDFAPNDVLAGWDGRLDGRPLNPQVLVYSVEVEFLNGEKRLFKGDVTLFR